MRKQSNYTVIQTGHSTSGAPVTKVARIKKAPSKEGASYKASQIKHKDFILESAQAYQPPEAPTLEAWLQFQSLINLASLARATWPDKSAGTAKARLHNHLTGEKRLSAEKWQQVLNTLRKFVLDLQTKLPAGPQ